ncbi:DUF1385 domain-containing protein [Alteribacillus bidgolensis]
MNTFEAGKSLIFEEIKNYSRLHQHC